ncbi:MAG: hypothetical protein N2Z40_06980 [Caldimicrobium sp.]|nr:hypothetical protein [Caldimicrobium sp.]MCX7613945.1 hypothetical protein [Caldimicrobium sp.]MDW8183353.1 hypothetical protein [Caldimicrobium sp.]
MEIKLITFLPEKPEEYLYFGIKALGLSEEDLFKLYFLTLKVKALSDVPVYKFLERAIPNIKFDDLGKKEFLLSLSVYSLRELLKEHLDLKFTKNLYLALKGELPPEFFKKCLPKREIVTSKDITFTLLNSREKIKLQSYLKVKHLHLVFQLKDNCENLLPVLPYLGLYGLRKSKDMEYEVYTPLSISDFVYISTVLVDKKLIKKIIIDGLTMQLKSSFPDCFG